MNTDPTDRLMKPAIWHGLNRRCPQCGKGHLFSGYLKTADTCEACDLNLSGHRADDGPAYLTILIVGHLLAFVMHFVWVTFRPDPLVMAVTLTAGCVVLSLYLLPRLKGMVIAIQWAKRMHGFRETEAPS